MPDFNVVPQIETVSPMEAAKHLIDLEVQKDRLEEKIKQIKKQLHEVMREHDTFQLKTGSYTIYRASRTSAKVLNVERLKQELDKRDIPYYLQEVFAPSMNEVFKALAKKEQDTIPGLEISESEYVGVRITKK